MDCSSFSSSSVSDRGLAEDTLARDILGGIYGKSGMSADC
jgi:hypothetical protein